MFRLIAALLLCVVVTNAVQADPPEPLAAFAVPQPGFSYSVAISPDNSMVLVSRITFGDAYVYSVASGSLLRQLLPEMSFDEVWWNADNTVGAIVHPARQVEQQVSIDPTTGVVIAEQAVTGEINGRRLAEVETGVYELREGDTVVARFTADRARFSADGTRVIAEYRAGSHPPLVVTVYDSASGAMVYEIPDLAWSGAYWHPDDAYVVTVPFVEIPDDWYGLDSAAIAEELQRFQTRPVQVRAGMTGEILYELPMFQADIDFSELVFDTQVPSPQFSPNGDYVLLYPYVRATATGAIVTAVTSARNSYFFEADRGTRFVWSPQNDAVLSCTGEVAVWGFDGTVMPFDLPDDDGEEYYICGTFSADGRLVATTSYWGRTQVWDRSTGELVMQMPHLYYVDAGSWYGEPVFSLDSTRLATWVTTDPPSFSPYLGAALVTEAEAVPLREAPDESSAIVSTLPLGTRLTVVDFLGAPPPYSGGWARVTTEEGSDGWVYIADDPEINISRVIDETLPQSMTLWLWEMP